MNISNNQTAFSNPISALFSKNAEDSRKALNLIRESRINHARRQTVRSFTVPKEHQLNFNADTLMDFLNWEEFTTEEITPPPLLMNFSNRELKKLKKGDLPDLPAHNQDCERAVKETTRASACSIGNLDQKRNILATKISRDEHNIEFNKRDFL